MVSKGLRVIVVSHRGDSPLLGNQAAKFFRVRRMRKQRNGVFWSHILIQTGRSLKFLSVDLGLPPNPLKVVRKQRIRAITVSHPGMCWGFKELVLRQDDL
jgi:hypothetical protein